MVISVYKRMVLGLALVPAGVAWAQPSQELLRLGGRQHLPLVLDMTAAVATGDVDGDGDQDVIMADGAKTRLWFNSGEGWFTKESALLTPKGGASALALGDVDGDGDLDLVVGYSHGANLLLLNLGTGRFKPAPAGNLPGDKDNTHALALGDVDKDGDLDLIAGNWNEGNDIGEPNRLYLNQGKGVFTDATPGRLPTLADCTSSLTLVDADRDGDLDLVVGNAFSVNGTFPVPQQDRFYLNDGKGYFKDMTGIMIPTRAEITYSLVCGDVDGDGDPDLVKAVTPGMWTHPGQNQLLLNNGRGTFVDGTAGRLPVDQDASRSIALGDVDGDRDLDLVIGNSGRNRLYTNQGQGRFIEASAAQFGGLAEDSTSVVLVDVDGDGDLDFLEGNTPWEWGCGRDRLWLNDGKGWYTDVTRVGLPVGDGPTRALVLGDVDKDGDLDLVVGDENNPLRLWLNDGMGGFSQAPPNSMPSTRVYIRALLMEDFDRDGDLDILLGTSHYLGEQNRIYLNDGKGSFTDVTTGCLPAAKDWTFALASGDVDGDGDLDLIAGGGTYPYYGWGTQNRLYLNNGSGRFQDATAQKLPACQEGTTALVLFDMDNDGDLDLFECNLRKPMTSSAAHRLYRNNGKGTFTDVTVGCLPSSTALAYSAVAVDVEKDGDLDLVLGNQGQNILMLNDGKGQFTVDSTGKLPVDTEIAFALLARDLDEDGDQDLVVGNYPDISPNRIYLNDGKGRFSDVTTGDIAVFRRSTHALALGDLDGDGDIDMLSGNDGINFAFLNHLRQTRLPIMARPGRTHRWDFHLMDEQMAPLRQVFPLLGWRALGTRVFPFGVLGIHPSALIVLSPLNFKLQQTLSSLTVNIPADRTLLGRRFFVQGLTVTPRKTRFANVKDECVLKL